MSRRRRNSGGHSRAQRLRGALAAGRLGDMPVASRYGVEQRTVAGWRGEFRVPAAGSVPPSRLRRVLRTARSVRRRGRCAADTAEQREHEATAAKFAQHYDYDLRRRVAKDPNAGALALSRVASTEIGYGLHPRKVHTRRVAVVPEAPGAGYRTERWVEDLRSLVAHNPAVSMQLLHRLAEAEDADVVAAVASSPYAPPPLLRTLASHPDSSPRAAAAANPRTPSGLLSRLSRDPVDAVRGAVLTHPDCPLEVTGRLAVDGPGWVRRRALRMARCPPDALAAAAADLDWSIRDIVVHHPNAPASALEQIASVGGWLQRRRARRRLHREQHS